MFGIDTYQYIAPSIRNKDVDGELRRVMKAIDQVFEEVAVESLKTSWDIENADRNELITITRSLGLHPKEFMTDDTLRRYIRSSGKIRELKGTDTLIAYLVSTITRFRVESIEVDENDNRIIRVAILRESTDFVREQKTLDFLIETYARLMINYVVNYLSYSNVKIILSLQTITKEHVRTEEYVQMEELSLTKLLQRIRSKTQGDVDNKVDNLGWWFHIPFELNPMV